MAHGLSCRKATNRLFAASTWQATKAFSLHVPDIFRRTAGIKPTKRHAVWFVDFP